METLTLSAENLQETIVSLESRTNQLEETIFELYRSVSRSYGVLDFAQMTPETFAAPYSIHAITIPQTNLSVTFITTPPGLVIGTPQSMTPGPLQWAKVLEIQLPSHTKFVSFCYGGNVGTVEWFGDDNSGYSLPTLRELSPLTPTRQFYLAKNEGIRGLKLTSSGAMVLHSLAIGIG